MLLARPCEKTSFHLEKTIRFETKILFVLRHKLIHVRISLTTSCLNANLITVNTSSNKLVVSLLIEDCVKVVLLTQSKDVLISLKKQTSCAHHYRAVRGARWWCVRNVCFVKLSYNERHSERFWTLGHHFQQLTG